MQVLIVFLAYLQITSALVIKVRPTRVKGQVRMRRPPLVPIPVRFVPFVGAGSRRPRPTIRRRTHIHVPINGRQFEHSHANGDVAHGHDFGFPAGIYPERGVGWDIPDYFRDSNTWAIFDKVNPDSVFVQDDEVYQPDNILNNVPDVMTANDGAMFPDSIVPSNVEVPIITPEFLPTSNKRREPAITRPLTPIVTGNINNPVVPKTNNTDNNNSTNVNKGQGSPGSPSTTDKTIIIVEKTTREPSCHKTGCLTGHECVFSNSYICPIYIPEVECKCRPGCRVDYTFIPYGTTVTMDTCGNTCSCFNMYGAASCSKKTCPENMQKLSSTGQKPEEVTMSTEQTPLPTQMSLDITTTDHLEINQPKDSVQMNFPVVPIAKSSSNSQ